MFTSLLKLFAVVLVIALFTGCGVSDTEEDSGIEDLPGGNSKEVISVPRMVFLIDETKSFEPHLPRASKIISGFIRETVSTSDVDIYLISIDAQPRVLKCYGPGELIDKDGNNILNDISRISPYDGTDIVGALELAMLKLNKKKTGINVTKKYLMCLSDMLVDNSKNLKKTFKTLDIFNWEQLSDVESSFLFVNSDKERELTSLLDGIEANIKTVDESP